MSKKQPKPSVLKRKTYRHIDEQVHLAFCALAKINGKDAGELLNLAMAEYIKNHKPKP